MILLVFFLGVSFLSLFSWFACAVVNCLEDIGVKLENIDDQFRRR